MKLSHSALSATLISTVALLLTACGGYEAAQKAYDLGEYTKAAKLLETVQRKEQNKVRKAEENFLLGECYRHLGLTNKSVAAYKRALKADGNDEAQLYLADALRAQGKFDEADAAYEEYAAKHSTDKRARAGAASSSMSRKAWKELDPKAKGAAVDSGYVIEPFKEIASGYSDFCPQYVGEGYDVVYFTSMRMSKKKKRASKITGQGQSQIYMSRIDGRGKWTEPQALEEPFGQKSNDDGVAYISPDGHTMVFTRCPLVEQEGSAAQAYESVREGGRWGDPVRIIPGGDSTLMVAHPTLSPDGNTLFFVSDKEGGIGGLDIWKSLRNVDGTWGPATNLGAIVNTAGDEMFPYCREDGALYFSSNGHKGYGGLDIYRAVENNAGRYEVTNMGLPINSTGDDFGITFMGTAEEGLLSSNRGNAKGYDNIYAFRLPPVILTIEGYVGKSGKKAFEGRLTKLESSTYASSLYNPDVQDVTPDNDNLFSVTEEIVEYDDVVEEVPVVAEPTEPAEEPVTSASQVTDPEETDAETSTSAPATKKGTSTTKKTSTSKSTTSKSSTAKKTTTSKSTSPKTSGTKTSGTKTTTAKKTTTGTKGTTTAKKTTGTAVSKTTQSKTSSKSSQTAKSAAKTGTKTGTKTAAASSTKTAKTKAGQTTTKKPATTTRVTRVKRTKKVTKRTNVPQIDPVPDSFVRIVGSDGTNIKMQPNSEGKISFVAEKDVRYIILSGAPGYANQRAEISTEGLNRTQTLRFTSLLDQVE